MGGSTPVPGESLAGDTRGRWVAGGLAATVLLVVGWDFASSTAFFGDDHIFLAFARHAPHPFDAFVADRHGGEYYRPVPMMLWWLLARAGRGTRWPFVLLGSGLHVTTALLTRGFARRCGGSPTVATWAGVLFLVAPAEREAALWFSASTDLLATAATIASVLCLARRTRASLAASLWLAAVAYLSKESAIVLPFLGAATLLSSLHSNTSRRADVLRVLAHAAVALAYLLARFAVLRGWGGAGDPGPSLPGRGLQVLSGLVHGLVGYEVLAAPVSWTLGTAALVFGIVTLVRGRRETNATWLPLVWIALAVLPLFAAGWVVGSRYFYLSAVGLAILVARTWSKRGPAVGVVAVGFLLALGTLAAVGRRAQLQSYHARVQAARDGVATGLHRGHRLFHVRCGIKDLDLVLKSEAPLLTRENDVLVLSDVPASFVLMPPSFAERTRFLRASPPLPPSGAYRFGDQEIVGLARRDESPDLEQVIERLPELQFIAVFPTPGTGFGWRDLGHNAE